MKTRILFIAIALCLTRLSLASRKSPSLTQRVWRTEKRSVDLNGKVVIAQVKPETWVTALHDSSSAVEKVDARNDYIAKTLGYLVGLGAMSLYVPIIGSLIASKDSSGYSVSTWVLNVLGSMLAIAYPIKRRFPISTYVEMVSGLTQSVLILGLVSLYQGLGIQYLQGIVPLLGLFAAFVAYDELSDRVLKTLQVAAIIVCTYANVPQIILTFQQGRASWSPITAGLSTIGCIIRIFTTLQLTKDKLILLGYSLGLTTNVILLAQILWYNYLVKK